MITVLFLCFWEVRMDNNIQVNDQYAAIQLIKILFERGLINKATYINVLKNYDTPDSHISHVA